MSHTQTPQNKGSQHKSVQIEADFHQHFQAIQAKVLASHLGQQQIQYHAEHQSKSIYQIAISSKHIKAHLLNYGGILSALYFKDYAHSLVLGFDQLSGYKQHQSLYLGTILGRVANRIAHAHLPWQGGSVSLDDNWYGHTLHGGSHSVSESTWYIVDLQTDRLTLATHLIDGDQGFPGDVTLYATYQCIDHNLYIYLESHAHTDTLVNLAHHAYFNLSTSHDVNQHKLMIHAQDLLTVNDSLIPTGTFQSLHQHALDFSVARQLTSADQLDHYFCVPEPSLHAYHHEQPCALHTIELTPSLAIPLSSSLTPATPIESSKQGSTLFTSPIAPQLTWHTQSQPTASLHALDTNIHMQVFTTEPGMQVYNATGMYCQTLGIHPHMYQNQAGIALETHMYPDAVHHEHFPSIYLPASHARIQATCLSFQSS